jgi:hypothetical protein
MKALIEKKLWVQKAKNVQGSVKIHFPDPNVQDIVLTSWEPVNVFGRIGMTAEQVKLSNLEDHILAGDVQLLIK